MKIPLSIRARYEEIHAPYKKLKELVDAKIRGAKSERWHYESRIKQLESYALKLETGREAHPGSPEDMLGCTIVVENHSKIGDAASLLTTLFREDYRRPPDAKFTSLLSHNFGFEDLRLYLCWVDEESLPPTGLANFLFEVQVKTFLQHAWGIATHDLVYKSDSVSWATSRVAFQVKAMLENAELSISEARRLTDAALLDKSDRQTVALSKAIEEIKQRWTDSEMLPTNVLGLAKNILDLAQTLRLDLGQVWQCLDAATAVGRGAKLLNLSPYASILEALVVERGASLLKPLSHAKNCRYLFIPLEIELPDLTPEVLKWVVTPKT